jgi:ubiquinone/menaquinone biosynthesis C-methylase UbiE
VTAADSPAGYARKYFDQFYSSRDWHFYRPLLAFILEHSEPGPILDVGAGTGLFVELVSRWNLPCTGIDASQGAIDIANERYPGINLIQHQVAAKFPFPDRSFQTLVMNQVIEHLSAPDGQSCIRECYRVLKPGGVLYIASPSKFNKAERDGDPTHRHLYSPSELLAVLNAAGFECIQRCDSPLRFLGTSKWGVRLASVIFHNTGWERLSGTANLLVRKP